MLYWPYISNSSIETKQHWSCDRTCVTQPSFSFETIDGICFACLCLALTGQYKLCLYHGCHPCWTSTSNLFNVGLSQAANTSSPGRNPIQRYSCILRHFLTNDLGSIHPIAVFCKRFFVDSVGEQLAFEIVSLTTLKQIITTGQFMSLVYRGSSSSKKNKTLRYIIVLCTMTFQHIPSLSSDICGFGMLLICSSFDWWVQCIEKKCNQSYDMYCTYRNTILGRKLYQLVLGWTLTLRFD